MTHKALLVVDLGFGDSGKGTLVDYLVRRHAAELVVRFNGGPQAGHNVVQPDGRHHTFAQFGSGTFVPGVRTLLAKEMLIEPYALLNEAAHLQALDVGDALRRLLIDERCLVIAPPQQVANRMRERARGAHAHGTCGLGVGECAGDALEHPEIALRAGDLGRRDTVRRKLRELLELKRAALADQRAAGTPEELQVLDDPEWIDVAVTRYQSVARRANIVSAAEAARQIRAAQCLVGEGAQGVLLDEQHGFYPHTTWSCTTFANAEALLAEACPDAPRERIGVLRTYLTRHGAGPLVTAGTLDSAALPEPHNPDGGWPGSFRRGVLDLVMLRYALAACGGVDVLAVTHLDRVAALPASACAAYEFEQQAWEVPLLPAGCSVPTRVARTQTMARAQPRYAPWPNESADAFLDALQAVCELPVRYRSRGPTCQDKW